MAFIIDRNALKAINRRTSEHLRSQDGNINKNGGQDSATGQGVKTSYFEKAGTETPNQAAYFSQDDIRNALMLAKKRIAHNAETMRPDEEILDDRPEHAASTKKF